MSHAKIVVAIAALFVLVPIALVAYVEVRLSDDGKTTAANQAAASSRAQATARAYNSALADAAESGPLTQAGVDNLEHDRGVGFAAVRIHGTTTIVTYEIIAPYTTALGDGGVEGACFQSTLTAVPTGRPVSTLSELPCNQLLPVPAPAVSKTTGSA